jgi:hypothetical protein
VTQSDFNFSSYSEAQFAFEAIGASAWKSLSGLLESRLAASQLVGAYFEYRAGSFDAAVSGCEACQAISQHYDATEEDAIYTLSGVTRRNALLTAISLLDSFLSDALRFLFLYWPHTLPADVPEKRKPEEDYPDYIERIVRWSRRFSSQGKRVGFLTSEFKVDLDAWSTAELSRLTALRNEITHHSGFYRFVVDPGTGGLRSEEKPLPYVTEEDAKKASVIVGDVCDAIYVSMSLRIFGVPPQVRPVNPDLAVVHKDMRKQWVTGSGKPPVIEEFSSPNWSMKVLSDPGMPWVGDELDAWMIIPSGIDLLPPSISFRWNNRHGMKAWASVDNNPREEIDTYSSNLLDQMLAGQSVVVEYYENQSDGPKYARFSLDGLAKAWHTACKRKEESKNA